MDTMKVLLGATIALLVGAVVLSYQGMQQGGNHASSDEISRLKKQIDELRLEQDRLQIEKQMQQLKAAEATSPPPTNAERDALRAELAAKEAEIARIAEERANAERDTKLADAEELEMDKRNLEKGDSELRRARLIADALLMGRVREFAEDPEYGSFVTFEVLMPENVQQGSVLAIRRNTGVIGQIRVSEITVEGAIGNLLPGFGNFKPQAGDELILPPQ